MKFIERAWYDNAGWLILLWPLSLVFQMLVSVRRKLQQRTVRPAYLKVPVVIIGNISVGGTGKTSLLITLVKHFKAAGYSPGVVSRGYGASVRVFPYQVNADSDVTQCGDEPLLIQQRTGCPVVVDPNRNRAVQYLLEHNRVDLVFSDDGLQHYKLYRDIEIAVVDGQRLFGNGFSLPAGPLRERAGRLQQADFIVINGTPAKALAALEWASVMKVEPRYLVNLKSGEQKLLAGAPFSMGNIVQAVAALGNPERFFAALSLLPYQIKQIPFPDHHSFSESDFESGKLDPHQPIVMTEKDAVKCQSFARANFWSLAIEIELDKEFVAALTQRITACKTSIQAQRQA
ncbi:MAG: tetraacyldisaccharide 4'-kinase [Gammaproteobacteria bacterium]|nr:tetraacyldisaccharide 4'-kinase [Gammaproteobacteria bacterium]